MTYEEIVKKSIDEEEILKHLFSNVDEKTFSRIVSIILQNRFLKKFLDKLYYFQKVDYTILEKPQNNKYHQERLVALNKYDTEYDGIIQLHPRLFISPELYISDKEGSLPIVFVRESIIKFLLEVLKLLPTGYNLIIYEGFRTIDCQEYLYYEMLNKKVYEERDKKENYSVPVDEIVENIKKNIMPQYIANPENLFAHNTGGAIDIRICDSNDVSLNYGCRFNEYETTADLKYYEERLDNGASLSDIQLEALLTRRVTLNIFNKAINDNNFDFISLADCHLDINNPEEEGISTIVYESCEKEETFVDPEYTIVEYLADNNLES